MIDQVLDTSGLSEQSKAALEDGNFDVRIESADDSSDQLVVHPEGNVSEKIAIKPSYSEQYLSQFQSDDWRLRKEKHAERTDQQEGFHGSVS